jgi:hypothetical protein
MVAAATTGMLAHGRGPDHPPRPSVHMPAKGPAGTGVDGRQLKPQRQGHRRLGDQGEGQEGRTTMTARGLRG